MIRAGLILILIAVILWFYFPFSAMFPESQLNDGIIISAIIIGLIGGLSILIGVSKDRYKEYKEEKKNDDYRKY